MKYIEKFIEALGDEEGNAVQGAVLAVMGVMLLLGNSFM